MDLREGVSPANSSKCRRPGSVTSHLLFSWAWGQQRFSFGDPSAWVAVWVLAVTVVQH